MKFTKLFHIFHNLHTPIHIHDINPLLHVSTADSHHQEAVPTLKVALRHLTL